MKIFIRYLIPNKNKSFNSKDEENTRPLNMNKIRPTSKNNDNKM